MVPYFRGDCLDIGAGMYKVFPHFHSVDNGHHWGTRGVDIRVKDAADLSRLASASWDLAYSSHLLEHFEPERIPAVLKEWMRVVRPGGHLILYVPSDKEYPKVGEFGANPDHKANLNYENVVEAMEKMETGWDLLDFQDRNKGDEYSLFFVFQRGGKGHRFSWKDPKPAKTACVVRFGAQGDNIQAASLFPALKEQGYHVTFVCQSGVGHDVVKHDPHVDRFIIQDKDAVPPQFLKEYFEEIAKRYTKFINLCEVVEYHLLAIPGTSAFTWDNLARKKLMDFNYTETIHAVAGVPGPYRPKFYSTLEERAWARQQKDRMGKRVILWSLAGSSNHKVWPHMDDILLRLLPSYEDVHVVLVGDESCKLLEQGWCRYDEVKKDFVETNSRIHLRSAKWTIRQSMAFAEVADLIIGTETGLLNAAGMMDTPKIINLSHSSQEMLTKHWVNTIVLEQPEGEGCPKRHAANGGACRQLHGGANYDPWVDCPKHEETGTSLCQVTIRPESMWQAIQQVLGEAPPLMKRAA